MTGVHRQQQNLPTAFENPRLLGKGATSEVYECWDRQSRRQVAVKKVVAGLGDLTPADLAVLELDAADALRAVPGVLRPLFADLDADAPYLVYDHIRSGSLAQRYLFRTMARDELMAFAVRLAGLLASVHALGSVHGDLSVGNIYLEDGQPLVGDWGTTIGCTPGYAAPEVESGGVATAASDVWSLGRVLVTLALGVMESDDEPTVGGPTEPVVGDVARTLGSDDPLTELLEGVFALNPIDRPTAATLMARFRRAQRVAGVRVTNPATIAEVVIEEPAVVSLEHYVRQLTFRILAIAVVIATVIVIAENIIFA